jgi:hypothetical protein
MQGNGTEARLSLARTAKLLVELGADHTTPELAPETSDDLSPTIEATDWGQALRVSPVSPPITIDAAPMRWDCPAASLAQPNRAGSRTGGHSWNIGASERLAIAREKPHLLPRRRRLDGTQGRGISFFRAGRQRW